MRFTHCGPGTVAMAFATVIFRRHLIIIHFLLLWFLCDVLGFTLFIADELTWKVERIPTYPSNKQATHNDTCRTPSTRTRTKEYGLSFDNTATPRNHISIAYSVFLAFSTFLNFAMVAERGRKNFCVCVFHLDANEFRLYFEQNRYFDSFLPASLQHLKLSLICIKLVKSFLKCRKKWAFEFPIRLNFLFY